jgi:hypothetical protein
MAEFKIDRFGANPVIVHLTRKQIMQMHEMMEHFKDQETFALKYEDGKLTFNFTIDFDKD